METRLRTQTKAASAPSFAPERGGVLQRKCACGGTPGPAGECEGCRKKKLQRRLRNQSAPYSNNHLPSSIPEVPPIVYEIMNSPGEPLDAKARAFMEPRFGHDFGDVRVHTDPTAAESAHAVNALAYTVGREVVFGAGQYRPNTEDGKRLLAHELTHVVQQTAVVSGRSSLRIGNPNESCEREAEAQQRSLFRSEVAVSARGPVVQRALRPLIMRSPLPFSSTVEICHSLLKTREFKVAKAGVRVNLDTRWIGPDEGAASCETHRRQPYNVTLTEKGWLFDDDYGSCEFDPEGPSSRAWLGVPPDDYYLTIWTNNTNPNCCLTGDIEVSEDAGPQGESCTKLPDSALTILHGALDIAGLVPAARRHPRRDQCRHLQH